MTALAHAPRALEMTPAVSRGRRLTEPALVRWTLTALALAFLALFLALPMVLVFAEALRNDLSAYVAAIVDPDTLAEFSSPCSRC